MHVCMYVSMYACMHACMLGVGDMALKEYHDISGYLGDNDIFDDMTKYWKIGCYSFQEHTIATK